MLQIKRNKHRAVFQAAMICLAEASVRDEFNSHFQNEFSPLCIKLGHKH